jgi:hypothetical protein
MVEIAEALEGCPSTYYYRPKRTTVERAQADAELRDAIERVQARICA